MQPHGLFLVAHDIMCMQPEVYVVKRAVSSVWSAALLWERTLLRMAQPLISNSRGRGWCPAVWSQDIPCDQSGLN